MVLPVHTLLVHLHVVIRWQVQCSLTGTLSFVVREGSVCSLWLQLVVWTATGRFNLRRSRVLAWCVVVAFHRLEMRPQSCLQGGAQQVELVEGERRPLVHVVHADDLEWLVRDRIA